MNISRNFLIFLFVLIGLGTGFSAFAASGTCPTDNGAGVVCSGGTPYFCSALSGCSAPSQCANWSGSVCSSVVEAAGYCPVNCNGADSCGFCNSCTSGNTLCGAYPAQTCKANVIVPTGCSSYNQCTNICSACSAGYELVTGNCVGATLRLGVDSVTGTFLKNSTNPLMSILSSGNVGIGITDPNDIFSIGNAGSAPLGSVNTGHNYTSTYLSADDYALTNYGLVKTLIASATSSSALFGGTLGGNIWNLNTGNVGIGTTTPTSKLHIYGTNPNLTIEDTGGSTVGILFKNLYSGTVYTGSITNSWTGNGMIFTSPRDINQGGFRFKNATGGEVFAINTLSGNTGVGSIFNSSVTAGSKLSVAGNTSIGINFATSSAPANGLIVEGNVGIGTTAPGYKLDVNGTVHVTAGGLYGLILGDPSVAGSRPRILQNSPAGIASFNTFQDNSVSKFSWGYGGAGTSPINSFFISRTSDFSSPDFLLTPTGTFGIGLNGNVGIGATAPNDTLSIGNSGSAPVGSLATGHNYTMTYLSSDPYALMNYGTTMSLINAATSTSALFGGTLGGNIWNLNSGNVGIGTSTPTSKLHINGEEKIANGNVSLDEGRAIVWRLGASDTGWSTGSIDTTGYKMTLKGHSGFTFITNQGNSANTVMQISGLQGFVGIGGIPATTNFQVSQNTAGVGGVSNSAGGTTVTGDANCSFFVTFKVGDSITIGGETKTISSITSSTVLDVSTPFTNAHVGAAYTLVGGARLSVLGNGNIGIGTTAPTSLLDVNGIISSGYSSGNGEIKSYQAPASPGLYISLKTDNVTVHRSGIFRSNAGFFSYYNTLTGDVGMDAQYSGANLLFQIGSVEKMRLSNNGNVGIGTTIPNDIFSIGNSGSAPIGSDHTGHNYTMSYLTSDPYALVNYGTTMSLINAATSTSALWGGTTSGNIWSLNSGNVGVGTTNPQTVLSVSSDGNGLSHQNSSNVLRVYTQLSSDNSRLYMRDSSNTGQILLNTFGVSYLNGGNVGIGTTTPGAKLEVNGNAIIGDVANIGSDSLAVDGTVSIGELSTGTTGGVWLLQQQTFSHFYRSAGVLEANPRFKFDRDAGGSAKVGFLFGAGGGAVVDTNIFRDSANVLRTNDSMIIDGNVGIGTSIPNDKLSIGNSGVAPIGSLATGHNYTMTYLSSDPYALMNYGTVMTLLNAATSTSALWGGSTSGDIWSLNSGKVGIGTTTPNSKLNIIDGTVSELRFNSGASSVTPTLAVGNLNSGGKFAALIAGTGGAGFYFDDSGFFDIVAAAKSTYIGNSMGASGASRLRIDSAGNVGIGTTSPAYKLDVASASNQNYTRVADSGGNVLFGMNTNYGGIWVNQTTPTLTNYSFLGGGVSGDTIFNAQSGGKLFFTENNAIKMTIVGGKVGIGTSIPNDTLSIGNSGVAPIGSLATGHNFTMTYLSSDPYALMNYGTTMSLINAATSSLVTQPVFATSTVTTYIGSQGGSYTGANALCAAVVSGSHVCTTGEIFNTINSGHTADIPVSTLWINNGPPGYTANANDCMGWSNAAGTNYGTVWIKTASGDGFGSLQACNNSRSYACCK